MSAANGTAANGTTKTPYSALRSADVIERAKSLRAEGRTMVEIGHALGCDRGTASRLSRGLDPQTDKPFDAAKVRTVSQAAKVRRGPYGRLNRALARSLYEQGLPDTLIAERCGSKVCTVQRWRSRAGMPANFDQACRPVTEAAKRWAATTEARDRVAASRGYGAATSAEPVGLDAPLPLGPAAVPGIEFKAPLGARVSVEVVDEWLVVRVGPA